MASSSSLKHKKDYDIFLSFRGTDVRKNFLSHLYTTLNQKGLSTYIDNKEMRKGEEIRLALMKAIEESHFAIIIFSKNYASSQWCLEELVKIKECKVRKDLIVLPVFYKVEPREVKKMVGSYGRAMAEHESKLGKYSQKVTRWRKALSNIGNLCGWHLNDEVEAEFIEKIVNKISMQLERRPLHVAKHLVGIHPRVIELNSMLKLKSDDCVHMIGLWGPGGIGKTTLGLALYDNISRQFVGSCFLENIRKALEDRLCRKKVLLVLNNVTDQEQLNALAGKPEWFGEGSRIIIITRDKHLLTSHGIDEDYIYEVKPLENYNAFELFTIEAFLSRNHIRRDLVNGVLHYANGHPLALMVLGQFPRYRSEREWESRLHNLANIPNKIINDTFKWSYVGLDNDAKQIFLDIACLFTGHSKEYIMKVLDSHDFDPVIGVKVLVEKSLIIEERETLRMCNLIQLMAMDIIRQECPNDPGRRSKLWLFDDFRSVLSRQLVRFASVDIDFALLVFNFAY
ncbi:hypothetical protein EUGRSUZ_H00839 [Eucalyptus grandis]|uniref:Uncharacterized protein n=2 Tax=Eucalyptus grandis TaxID=71139 RepID=A0ACC3JMJ0_EUCGR|nr:hypothetical protein EUGRSUZ_H00839 [Eucalyptus grandis]